MSIQVLPTAPSPTVTHLMNREALDAMAARASLRFSEPRESGGETGEERATRRYGKGERKGGTDCVLAFLLALGRDFLPK